MSIRDLGYSSRDIEMLESIAGELAVSIRKTLCLWREINELNKSLQRKIGEATKELVVQAIDSFSDWMTRRMSLFLYGFTSVKNA